MPLLILFVHLMFMGSECAANGSWHWIAAGDGDVGEWGSYSADILSLCQNDSSSQAAISAPQVFGHNIATSCCTVNGSSGVRPNCTAYPVTYDQAAAICQSVCKMIYFLLIQISHIHIQIEICLEFQSVWHSN